MHESWTFKDGAPEIPTALAQTADGYLWIGAASGLFRFDGARFQIFRPPFGEPLQSTNVSALLAAGDGLWVGYLFGGFSLLKNGSVTNFVETTGTVTGFAQDANGAVWAGSTGRAGQSALWRFDGAAWRQIGAEWNVPEKPVAQLGFDRDGILWVLIGVRDDEVPKELYFLAPGSRQFTRAAANLYVVTFTWDADNRVLTSREGGLPEPRSPVELQSAPHAYPILRRGAEIFLDRANSIWLVSSKTDVLRHPAAEPLAQTVARISPANSEAYDIYPNSLVRLVDREGSIWFGA